MRASQRSWMQSASEEHSVLQLSASAKQEATRGSFTTAGRRAFAQVRDEQWQRLVCATEWHAYLHLKGLAFFVFSAPAKRRRCRVCVRAAENGSKMPSTGSKRQVYRPLLKFSLPHEQ